MSCWEKTNKFGVALYSFKNKDAKTELPLKIGDPLHIKEESKDWFRVKNILTQRIGIVPKNYVDIINDPPPNKEEYLKLKILPSIKTNPIIIESQNVLIEWKKLLDHICYQEKNFKKFSELKYSILTLMGYRENMLKNKEPNEETIKIQENQIIDSIDRCKRLLNIPVFPRRENGEIADENNIGLINLYQLHSDQIAQNKGITQKIEAQSTGQTDNNQLVLDFQMAILQLPSEMELQFFLFDNDKSEQVSESYSFRIERSGMHADINLHGKLKTIFKDIPNSDLTPNLYLVCRMMRLGVLLIDEKLQKKYSKKKCREYRRPFGCGILQLSETILKYSKGNMKEETINMFLHSSDFNFFKLHKMLISGEQGLKPLPGPGVKISWVLYAGEYEDLLSIKELELNNKLKEMENAEMIPTDIESNIETENEQKIESEKSFDQKTENENQSENQSENQNVNEQEKENKESETSIQTNSIQIETQNKKELESKNKEEQEYIESLKYFKHIGISQEMKFPEVILPSYIRNDLYITVHSGEFLQDRKRSAKNVEMRIYVRKNNAEKFDDFVENCISFGNANETINFYKTYVYYHKNNPFWEETIRITMPTHLFEETHLYIEAYHCTTNENHDNKLFGFAFLPFFQNEAMIKQGKVTLPTYKYVLKTLKEEPTFYLQQPDPKLKQKSKLTQRKEQIELSINLCSTKLTQVSNIIGLLKWKGHSDDLSKILKDLTFSAPSEIVKFIREILDTLFQLLEEKGKDEQSRKMIYESIDFVIGIVADKRFKTFMPVVNDYIQTRFSRASNSKDENTSKENEILTKSLCKVYVFYMDKLKSMLSDFQESNRKTLLNTLRVIEYIFKFIIYSWLLNIHENPIEANNQQKFISDIKGIILKLQDLMSRTQPVWINAAQDMALRNFKSIFFDLSKVLRQDDLTNSFKSMILSIRMESLKVLNHSKLDWIISLLKQGLFDDPDSRSVIFPLLFEQISFHYKQSEEELKLCIDIVKIIINKAFEDLRLPDSKNSRNFIKDISRLPRKIFELLAHIKYLEEQKIAKVKSKYEKKFQKSQKEDKQQDPKKPTQPKNTQITSIEDTKEYKDKIARVKSKREELKRGLVTSILMLFSTINQRDAQLFFEKYDSRPRVRPRFVDNVFSLFMDLIKNPIYLGDFERFEIIQYKIIMKGFKMFHTLMKNFTGRSFIFKLWNLYLETLICFINLPKLQLEKLSNFEKHKILEFCGGDLRLGVVDLLDNSWKLIGKREYDFISNKTEDFLSFMLLDNEKIKELGLNIYYSMLKCEIEKTQNFKQIEQSTVDTIYHFIREEKDKKFTDYFFKNIEPKFKQDSKLKEKSSNFVEQVHQLMNQITKLKDYPEQEKYEDERTFVLLNLMDYLYRTKRYSMYSRYTHLLSQLHFKNGNFTEAALALTKVIEILEWNEETIEEKMDEGMFNYPRESSSSRKERIILNAIDYFDKGKSWENTISLIDSLQEQYQKNYEYEKLSDLMKRKGEMYSKIVSTERFFANYFRIGYYGNGFNQEIYREFKNKEFIYRGAELEQLSVFMGKIKAKFPEAKIGSDDPNIADKNKNIQYIQISSLTTSSFEEKEGKKKEYDPKMPEKIKRFYQNNGLQVFMYSKPFRKTKEKSDNEFKDLWLRTTYLISEDPFPLFIRRSPVKEKIIVELSPIHNAINSVNEKNDDLEKMITKYEDYDGKNVSPFSMAFNGVIDAAVNGGVFRYQDAFFNPDFLKEDKQHENLVKELKLSLKKQQEILEAGVSLHSRICPDEMRPFHENMEKQFAKMKGLILPSLQDLN
eukprot:Anaeramoba_ignava/c21883_g2_i1.p1 GENE.c21883_g2_i1~~c21883_g2_i1.p1  ORF type:complete len:1811 (+),score=630.08 c21883_g2_i1:51-5435(+)